jgi:hypothetical protein
MTWLLLMAGSVALFALGHWGRRNADLLVPVSLDPVERGRRTMVLRRGSLTCCAVAVLFLVAAIAGVCS